MRRKMKNLQSRIHTIIVILLVVCMMCPLVVKTDVFAVTLTGSSNAEKVFNYFNTHGYTPQAAAAITANLIWESGGGTSLNIYLHTEEVTSNPNKGIGMVQWTGSRRTAFENYCISKGTTWTKSTLELQMDYLLHELNSGSQWFYPSSVYGTTYNKYNKTFSQFKNLTDIDVATGAFCFCFERPSATQSGVASRIANAKRVLEIFSGECAFIPYLEYPSSGGNYSGMIRILGYALHKNGIRNVTAWVNGQVMNCPMYNSPDVAAEYPGYPTGNEGFQTQIPISCLKEGENEIVIYAYEKDDTPHLIAARKFNWNSFVCKLESPIQNKNYEGTLSIQGYALHKNGIRNVTAWVNGQVMNCPMYNRSEIEKEYPGYPTGNEGFQTQIPISCLKEGENEITIYAYEKDDTPHLIAYHNFSYVKKSSHTHDYISSVKKNATCTEPGIILYTCKDNDDSYEEEIPATGHQHTELRNVKEATYDQEGYTGDTCCTDCGAKLSSGKSIPKLRSYSITYHLNGGTNNIKNPKTYTSEQNALTILDPTKEHYTFNGWYLSKTGNEKFVSGNTYNKDLDLYARWSPKTYQVTYNPNGGTLKGATVQSVTYGEKYGTLRSVEREGYTFLGWYTSLTGTTKVTENTICNGDIVLYAHWQKVEVPDAGDDKKDDTNKKDDVLGKDDSSGKDDTTNKDDEKEDQTPVEKPHVHEYMLTKTIKATCLKNGRYVYTCICGAEKSLVISNEGMEHRWIEVIDKKATTTEKGVKHLLPLRLRS